MGNQSVINRLKMMVQRKDIPNMIIYGPPGVGKTISLECMLKEIYDKDGKT